MSSHFLIPTGVCCKEAFRSPLSITDKAVTTTSVQVKNVAVNDLQYLMRSDKIWSRCIEYAGSGPNPQQYPRTLDAPGVDRRPTETEYNEAALHLHLIEALVLARKPDPLNSTFSVQDEMKEQLLNLVNVCLRTRYTNRVVAFTDANNNPVPPGDTPHFPRWSRSSPAHHPQPGTRKDAGNSDFILNINSRNTQNKAVVEGKAHWVYKTEHLLHMYYGSSQGVLTGQNSKYLPNVSLGADRRSARELFLQVYGELALTKTDLAFFGNLEVCFIMVRKRTANQNNWNVILSTPMKWIDPRLPAAFTGFSFLAVDSDDWTQGGQFASVGDLLCPDAEIVPLHSPLPPDITALLQAYGV